MTKDQIDQLTRLCEENQLDWVVEYVEGWRDLYEAQEVHMGLKDRMIRERDAKIRRVKRVMEEARENDFRVDFGDLEWAMGDHEEDAGQ